METLVVADTKMVEYHGSENVESYVLTIMNMVCQEVSGELVSLSLMKRFPWEFPLTLQIRDIFHSCICLSVNLFLATMNKELLNKLVFSGEKIYNL